MPSFVCQTCNNTVEYAETRYQGHSEPRSVCTKCEKTKPLFDTTIEINGCPAIKGNFASPSKAQSSKVYKG